MSTPIEHFITGPAVPAVVCRAQAADRLDRSEPCAQFFRVSAGAFSALSAGRGRKARYVGYLDRFEVEARPVSRDSRRAGGPLSLTDRKAGATD
jgi:hypothetical protein